MIALSLLAGASLSFLPLSVFVVRVVIARDTGVTMPPLPAGSIDRSGA